MEIRFIIWPLAAHGELSSISAFITNGAVQISSVVVGLMIGHGMF